MILPHERYTSLMHRREPIFDCGDWSLYDFTSEGGTYVYRDLKKKKYTPIDESHVKKCKKILTDYLATEHDSKSEFLKCFEGCNQPWKRFLAAVILLWEIENKIEIFRDNGKDYLALVDRKKPIEGYAPYHEPNNFVLSAELAKKLEENEESVQNLYKQYRETYGR